ncbi:hypothetical protein JCM10212_000625 [Sporobolomyces blumeae]
MSRAVPERFPLTPRSSTDSLRTSSPPRSSRPALVRLDTSYDDSTDLDIDERDDRPPVRTDRTARRKRKERRNMFGGGRHRHSLGATQDADDSDDEDDGGGGNEDMQLGEVAGLIVAGTLSPLPLLVPYACFILTPALFVPLLALSGLLAWSSAVALGVQGRYVGARSYPALACAVFPHRFKLHRVGEFLASSFVLGGSIVRTTLGVVAAAEVVVDLVVPERRRRDWERTVAVAVISLIWLVVPLVLTPLLRSLGLSSSTLSPSSSSVSSSYNYYSRLASSSTSLSSPYPGSATPTRPRPHWTALLRLPAYFLTFATWPLALLILSIRLKRINRDYAFDPRASSASSAAALARLASDPLASFALQPASIPFLAPEDPMSGLSLWPSILLTLSALSSTSHETFYYLTSLARPSSTAVRSSSSRSASSAFGTPFLSPSAGDSDPEDGGGGGGGGGGDGFGGDGEYRLGGDQARGAAKAVGKRNQYPLAMAIGIGISFLVQLGWALVGSIGLAQPDSGRNPDPDEGGGGGEGAWIGPTGNLLSDPRLPRGDFWLGIVRVLVLIGVLGQLDGHARVGIKRVRRGVDWFFPKRRIEAGTNGVTASTSRAERGSDRGGEGSSTLGQSCIDDESSRSDSPVSPSGATHSTPSPATRAVASTSVPPGRRRRFNLPVARTVIFLIVTALSLTIVSLPVPHKLRDSPNYPSDGRGRGGTGNPEGDVGGHGIGLVYLAEWAGVGLGGLGCCLIPSLTYLILFHLLPPRSILGTDQTTDDALLLSKEREIQRRLGGRRLWTDVAVFAGLGPVGVVVVVRGVWALCQ